MRDSAPPEIVQTEPLAPDEELKLALAALCDKCDLRGKPDALTLRKWAFDPPVASELQTASERSLGDNAKHVALRCLSRFREGNCTQPPPEINMEERQ